MDTDTQLEVAVDDAITDVAQAGYRAATALQVEIAALTDPAEAEDVKAQRSNDYMLARGELLTRCRELLDAWDARQENFFREDDNDGD